MMPRQGGGGGRLVNPNLQQLLKDPDMMYQAWEEVWGERIHVHVYGESLCCPPGTITTLLICYTPIKNKNSNKQTNKQAKVPIQELVVACSFQPSVYVSEWGLGSSSMSGITISSPQCL